MTRDPIDIELSRVIDAATSAPASYDDLVHRVLIEREATTTATKPKRRSSGLYRGVAAVAAVAACIGAVVAFAPRGVDDASQGVVGPATAAAQTLREAGDAAAEAPWRPLPSGEFEYVHTLTYTLPNSAMGGGPQNAEPARTWDGPWEISSNETWIGRDDVARNLYIIDARRDDADGKVLRTRADWQPAIQSYDWSGAGKLPHIRAVNVTDGKPRVEVDKTAVPGMTLPQSTTEGLMRQTWSATLTELEGLPDSGPDLDQAVESLITSVSDRSGILHDFGYLTHGMTQDQVRRELRIEEAINLLGNAPLTPNARRAVFRWLAQTEGARLIGEQRDRLGRSGTAVEFEYSFERTFKPGTVTDHDVIQQLLDAGVDRDDIPVKPTGRTFEIPGGTSARTWRMTIIVDTDTGDLLQARRGGTETRARAPQLTASLNGATRSIELVGGSGSQNGHDGTVWVDRTRTKTTDSNELLCAQVAGAC